MKLSDVINMVKYGNLIIIFIISLAFQTCFIESVCNIQSKESLCDDFVNISSLELDCNKTSRQLNVLIFLPSTRIIFDNSFKTSNCLFSSLVLNNFNGFRIDSISTTFQQLIKTLKVYN